MKVGQVATDAVVTVADWWKLLLTKEDTDPEYITKAVLSAANYELNKLMLAHVMHYGENKNVIGLEIKDATVADADKKKTPIVRCHVQRFELADQTVPATKVMLPFWGKVVCETVAMHMSKASCVPLGDAGGLGPKLFIDGSANNIGRSSGCIAWLIPPVGKKKEKPPEEVGTIVVEADAKKAKTAAEKKKVECTATHITDYMDLTFDVAGTPYNYTVPYLKDNPEFKSLYNVKCLRERTPWDDGEIIKKAKVEKEQNTFLSL
jgi:hypothetical protein